MITIGPLHSIWFGNRMSDEPEQTIFPPAEVRDKALQLLSLVICRIVDIGKSITTDRLHFERDKLKHGVVRLERSSFAFAFHKESQKEDEKRGKAIAYNTAKEASTDMVHYNIIDPPGHRDFVRFQIDDIPEPCALFTAETTTFQCIQCYFVQGWFKCGGVEICKTRFAIGMNKKERKDEPGFLYSWWSRRRVRGRCLLVSLRGLPYQVYLGSQLRKWGAGHWTEGNDIPCAQRKSDD